MYRANNTLIHVQRNTYCGLQHRDDVRVNAYYSDQYVIRYFSFSMLRRRPAMHIEGFNMHALEGAIHIARSISFVAIAAICIDKTNIF